jgi:hypothetical protein
MLPGGRGRGSSRVADQKGALAERSGAAKTLAIPPHGAHPTKLLLTS